MYDYLVAMEHRARDLERERFENLPKSVLGNFIRDEIPDIYPRMTGQASRVTVESEDKHEKVIIDCYPSGLQIVYCFRREEGKSVLIRVLTRSLNPAEAETMLRNQFVERFERAVKKRQLAA
jgi:hypothetical protein